MENTNFFDRLKLMMNHYNIKSVNALAKDHLGYKSSEKINRLKRKNVKPSNEIILDIVNKFEDVSLEWLMTGNGEMLKSTAKSRKKGKHAHHIHEGDGEYLTVEVLLKELEMKNEQLKAKDEQLKTKDEQIEKLIKIIELNK